METFNWYTCECGSSTGYMPYGHMSKEDGRKCKKDVTQHVYAKVPGLSQNRGPAS